jgi:ParB-like chromosome segregation protein Spo0J
MSWNQKLTFAEGLALLREAYALQPPRADRPEKLPRGEIRMAHSVFQPRLFQEDLHKDEAHVEELTRALKAKPEGRRHLDPVLVVAVGNAFYCVDGHHRLLAYARAGVDGEVPVEVFPGGLEDALKEAIGRNSRDRLAMSHEEKLEAAWRLVTLGAHSKREIAEATGAAERTIANMRAVLRDLQAAERDPTGMPWRDAKRGLEGDVKRDFTDEMRAAQVREWAKRFSRAFGKKALGRPDVFGDALGLYSEKLPRALVEHWPDLAQEVAEQMAHELDTPF